MIGKKMSRALKLMALILSAWILLSPVAHALDVETAAVRLVGIDPRVQPGAGAMVMLEDLGPNPAWVSQRQFYLSPALGNAGLATILTAISLGQTVWVRIAGTGESGSLIEIIFLNAPTP